jgi:hypothetical protein
MKALQMVQLQIFIHQGDVDAAENALKALTELDPDDSVVKSLSERLTLNRPEGESAQWGRENRRRRREREDTRPLDEGVSLETCLYRNTKDILSVIARRLAMTGLSALRKGELVEAVAARLRDTDALGQAMTQLLDRPREALEYVLAQGGSVAWEAFSDRFDNDVEDSHLSYGEPRTAMGSLRLKGLLFTGTREGQRIVLVPAELRSVLNGQRTDDVPEAE